MTLPAQVWERITWREGSADWLVSRNIRLRGRAAQRDQKLPEPRAEEWLLIEWPEGKAKPTKDRLSTLPGDIAFAGLIDLAKLRWHLERDYQEPKQELGIGDRNFARPDAPRRGSTYPPTETLKNRPRLSLGAGSSPLQR